jgi:hypothetical protein
MIGGEGLKKQGAQDEKRVPYHTGPPDDKNRYQLFVVQYTKYI